MSSTGPWRWEIRSVASAPTTDRVLQASILVARPRLALTHQGARPSKTAKTDSVLTMDSDMQAAMLASYAPGVGMHDTGSAKPSAAPVVVIGPRPVGDYSRLTFEDKDQKTGVMKLSIALDATGRPARIQVVASLTPSLDQQAYAMAKKFRFVPCKTESGEPVPCTVVWSFQVRN